MRSRRLRNCRVILAVVAFLGTGSVLCAQCDHLFRRGDVNADSLINISDVNKLLNYLFLQDESPPCMDAADTDDDGLVGMDDSVLLLNFLFLGTTTISAPTDACGRDRTDDALHCGSFPVCNPTVSVEVCDGIDNDCDGAVDEGFDFAQDPKNCGACGVRCNKLKWPNVAAYACDSGTCVIAECEPGYYDSDGIGVTGCESTFPLNGTPCDDGNPCTENDMFFFGVCGGTPKDCSHLEDACNYGVCDRATGECVKRPKPIGTPCSDGDPVTFNDHCDGEGHCIGIAHSEE